MKANARTHNNAVAYEHSENHLLEFFSKAGSLYTNKGTYYGGESSALELFKTAWRADNLKSMKLGFWLRDCRGGAGNRSGFRAVINWLGNNYPEWIKANIALIPKYGRWDDLFALYNTPCEVDALTLWAGAILSTDEGVSGLACKWADRQDAKLRAHMGMSPKQFRKTLVSKTKVIETLMCQKQWGSINYNHVPSVASARYSKAFKAHDAARYDEWRTALAKPESGAKVNAETLMPHDVVRMVKNTSYADKNANALAEAQFKAMPNYLKDSGYRIMPILDFSGSMCTPVAGSIEAIDVALGLGLYCSDAVGKDNPFYRMVIPFSTTSKLESWSDKTLVDAINTIPNGYCGSTNITAAFKNILDSAKFWKIKNEFMPNVIMILSDMQFDQGVVGGLTPVEAAMKSWEDAGYTRPKIIYWNLAGYANQPSTAQHKDVAMISGFSPATLKSVLSGKDFTPVAIMNDTIEKYEVVTP